MFGDSNNLFGLNISQTHTNHQQSRQQFQLKSKKEEMMVSIRKQARENQIKKRRHLNSIQTLPVIDSKQPMNPLQIKIKSWRQRTFNLSQLKELHQCMKSNDCEKMCYGIIGVRKILSRAQNNPPIQEILDARMLPQIIRMAYQNHEDQIVYEAIWSLSALVSGDFVQTQTVIQKVGLQFFLQFLQFKNPLIVEHALWAIGNLAADRAMYRDQFINYGIIHILMNLITKQTNQSILNQSCWALSNIIRLNPMPQSNIIEPALLMLSHVVKDQRVTDISVLKDMLWSISYIIQIDQHKLQIFFSADITERLIELAGCGIDAISVAALRNIGHICFGRQQYVQQLLKKGLLNKFDELMNSEKTNIRKQIAWALSNIAASSASHLEYLYSHTSLIEKIYDVFINSQKTSLVQDCGYMFSNSVKFGDPRYFVEFFLNHKLVEYYLNFIDNNPNINLKEMGLKGINACLKLGANYAQNYGGKSVMMREFIDKKGIDILENAQQHQNHRIFQLASKILEGYFVAADPLKE